jgi:D-glutamate N-acetyltransferase
MRYRPEEIVALLDSTSEAAEVEGFPVVKRVADALPLGPTTALVGVATQGGRFPPAWRRLLEECLKAGLDLENGLHEFVSDDPELVALAALHGAELRDLRRPPAGLDVPTGANLTHGATTILTVGSDCAIGKMTVSLELDREARRRGHRSEFIPTGQTGIAIAGWGIAVDAVVADFIAGAAERLVIEGAARGGEVLFVEGQGSLLHPAYSGVTLGLIHGSAPHGYVLCHQAGETFVDGDERFPIPPLVDLVRLHEQISLLPRPAKVYGIALNTRLLDDDAARRAVVETEAATGLPADDPVRFGAAKLVDSLAPLLQS